MDRKLKYVVNQSDNAAALLKQYNHLKHVMQQKELTEKYRKYKDQIQQDIPRTFPTSKWMQAEANKDKIVMLLKMFLLHSNIGYIQGMMFLAVPLLKMYEKQEYCAFWSFVDISELLRPFYVPLLVRNNESNRVVLRILDLWQQLRKHKVGKQTLEMINATIHWKFITTLYFSITGNNLNNVELLLNYFMEDIQNDRNFIRKVSAFGLAILLSVLPDRQIETEDLQILSTCSLTSDALECVIKTSKQCEFLF